MFSEEDLLPLSALQHFVFCPRQCALIHIEQAWVENRYTAEGKIMHENAHEQGVRERGEVRIERGMSLRSFALGLTGKADVVEFRRQGGVWVPFPVEYKRGKPKADDCDKVQLCAQALCLEEVMNIAVPVGALFYGTTRRRLDVTFDEELRTQTVLTAERLHAFIAVQRTPPPAYEKKCDSCSFIDVCLPKAVERRTSVEEYLFDGMDES